MIQLRQSLDQDTGGPDRTLILAFDGGYTNATVDQWRRLTHTLSPDKFEQNGFAGGQQIPPRTICIGRIRKDAKLCFLRIPPS